MEMAIDKENCSVPYVCSLSKQVRAVVQVTGAQSISVIRRMVVATVEEFDANAELKASLQEQQPSGFMVRQVDIRKNSGEPILFKLFVMWNRRQDMWHVFVEGGQETSFEDGERNW